MRWMITAFAWILAGLALAKFPGARDLPRYDEMLERVRHAAAEVVKRKGHTSFAIGLCVRRICEAVLRDERTALAVSVLLEGQYGIGASIWGRRASSVSRASTGS